MSELPSDLEAYNDLKEIILKHVQCMVKFNSELEVLTDCIKESQLKFQNIWDKIKELGKEDELIDQQKQKLYQEFAMGKSQIETRHIKHTELIKIERDLNELLYLKVHFKCGL